MNKENRIGYIRKAMNLLKLKRILMAACMLLSLGFGMSSDSGNENLPSP